MENKYDERNLKNTTVRGVSWTGLDSIAKYGISFIITLILARLLTPEDYGLIAIISIFTAIFNELVETGFTPALIRKQTATEVDYNTVFIVNLVLSLVFALALFFGAVLIADFFNRPELVMLTRAMSPVILINALAIVQRVRLIKKIDFKTQTKISIIAALASGVIGITMASFGCGVWSLVGQQLSQQFLTTLLLWLSNKWIPKLQFSTKSLAEFWNFAWKLIVSGMINTIWKEIYNIIIGKVYSSATLGQYNRAHGFSQMFSSNLTVVVQKVSFPVLASIQDESERLRSAYRRIIKTIMFPTFVLMIGLACCSSTMIPFLIGNQWDECVKFLPLICFASILYPLHAINLNMLEVKGRSDLILKLKILKTINGMIPVFLGIYTGIFAMLLCSIVSEFIDYYLNAFYSGRFINYSFKEQFKDIAGSFTIAISMGLIVWGVSFIPLSVYILFPLQVVVGATYIILLCEAIKYPEYLELKDIISGLLKKI